MTSVLSHALSLELYYLAVIVPTRRVTCNSQAYFFKVQPGA